MNRARILISAYSDLDRDRNRRPLWGDYWLKHRLARALRVCGMRTGTGPDAVWLHLHGTAMHPPGPVRRRILWIHSHPEDIRADDLKTYDLVLSVSRSFADRLRRRGVPAHWLMVPTPMRPLKRKILFDAVFVGNVRHRPGLSPAPRPIINDLISIRRDLPRDLRIGIWGDGWKGLIPRSWYRGRAVTPSDLNRIYSSTRIVLNDHHRDMAREGFLNPRVLDGLAAGARVISDPVADMDGTLPGVVLPWRHADDLQRAILEMRDPSADQKDIRRRGIRLARRFCYAKTARRLVKFIDRI